MTKREPIWRRYLRLLGPDPAQDLDDELEFHRQEIIEEALAQGASREEAQARARVRLGDLAQPRRECLAIARRRVRRVENTERLAGLGQDIFFGVRSLRRTPAFTVVAILTLALGIGANAAIFSVVDGVLLRPLPYGHPEELVKVWEHNIPRDRPRNLASPANVRDWKDRARSFSGLAMYTWSNLTLTESGAAAMVSGRSVEPNFFQVLGVRPALGRDFVPADADSGAARVLIFDHDSWQTRFGGDSSVVGRSVSLAGGSAQVIGVAPAGFRPMGDEEFWEPLQLGGTASLRRGRYVMTAGRLREGVTVEQADAELKGIARQLEQEYPDFNSGWSAQVVGMLDDIVGEAKARLWITLGAVSLVLLIACANVGNLLLVRSSARSQELAVRNALGASRGRVFRLWIIESGLLAGIGLALGLFIGWAGIKGIQSLAPGDLPRLNDIQLNLRVTAVMAGITLVVIMVFSLIAFSGVSTKVAASLRSGKRTSPGRVTMRVRKGLVIGQVALALLLLVSAGLVTRTLQQLSRVHPGFEAENVWATELALSTSLYPDNFRWRTFFHDLAARLRGEPGVRDVGFTTFLPLSGAGPGTSFTALDLPEPEPGRRPVAEIRTVDSAYFTTMQIPLKQGRLLSSSENEQGILVNETLVQEVWQGGNPIGKQLKVSWNSPDSAVTVVGVVGDVHNSDLISAVRPTIYYSLDANPSTSAALVVRHERAGPEVGPTVRRLVAEMDRSVPLIDPGTMTDRVSAALESHRSPAVLLGMFATLALVLASVGLYGVLAYSVGLRFREIGVRVALGARMRSVVWMVVRDGLAITGAGLLIGVATALLATRVLQSMLYGVGTSDPASFLFTAMLLLVAALVACWLPAWRASRIDPAVTLRGE